jgi:NADH:ubiquinone oxidoreductase subunit 2 (subunit N)
MVGGLGQRDNEIAWLMLWQILGEYIVDSSRKYLALAIGFEISPLETFILLLMT